MTKVFEAVGTAGQTGADCYLSNVPLENFVECHYLKPYLHFSRGRCVLERNQSMNCVFQTDTSTPPIRRLIFLSFILLLKKEMAQILAKA